jgi:hypothetical protein
VSPPSAGPDSAATAIAVLLNPKNPDSEDEAKDVLEAGRALGVQIIILTHLRQCDLLSN